MRPQHTKTLMLSIMMSEPTLCYTNILSLFLSLSLTDTHCSSFSHTQNLCTFQNGHILFLTLVSHGHTQIRKEFIDTHLLLLILELLQLPCTFPGPQEDYIILNQENSSACPATEQGKYERFSDRFIRYSLIDLLSVEIYTISPLKQFFKKIEVSFFLVLMGFPS